jgi:hypothetical protein
LQVCHAIEKEPAEKKLIAILAQEFADFGFTTNITQKSVKVPMLHNINPKSSR